MTGSEGNQLQTNVINVVFAKQDVVNPVNAITASVIVVVPRNNQARGKIGKSGP